VGESLQKLADIFVEGCNGADQSNAEDFCVSPSSYSKETGIRTLDGSESRITNLREPLSRVCLVSFSLWESDPG
jgi:hypothetical protein